MSIIRIDIKHSNDNIWTAQKLGEPYVLNTYEHSWDNNTLKFTDGFMSLECEIELTEDEQNALTSCLIKDSENFVPHWQSLTPDLHRTIQRIVKEIWVTAEYVDHCLRKTSKGIRLSPLKLPEKSINPSQAFPVMLWIFSDEERIQIKPFIEELDSRHRNQYNNGLLLPFPVSFDQKTIYLRDDEVVQFFENIDQTDEIPPFWDLYGIAWENFAKNKAYDSSILILATSMETTLKWCLQKHGDDISNYLIDNMPSPSLEKLFDAVREYTTFDLPEHFRGWLKQLAQARNFIAHKPRGFEIDVLQIVRWFAMGEAILKTIINKENDPLVGFKVKPIGENVNEKFPPDTIGIVMRREKFQYEEDGKLHVVLDSGSSYYFSNNSCEKLPRRQQSFPDIV